MTTSWSTCHRSHHIYRHRCTSAQSRWSPQHAPVNPLPDPVPQYPGVDPRNSHPRCPSQPRRHSPASSSLHGPHRSDQPWSLTNMSSSSAVFSPMRTWRASVGWPRKTLQRAVSAHYNHYHIWAAIQAVIWGGALTAVGLRQNNIVRNSRWPNSRLASACVVVLGCIFTASCAVKTSEFIKAIPRGYDVVKVRNDDAGTDHLFLIRRDFNRKSDPRIVPMYLLSGLGLGTMIMGARIAFKMRKAMR
ncbi:hypothetical protein BC939DRAFT_155101 [Gamsiella multidivaricata]|uniref:uncharacterized protein n=1 Tax=Gamsiella multidivaricata TaxID=101098 RepID=UPI0022205491|nr:uncharacterized protein BC939DRAFT_155101 [Gamsiella multidivaricata]KAI7823778.1 hypothetical protein BC939DRAFT_155101 [Gamsiella multidivaricata]